MKKFHQLIARDIFNCLSPEEQEELKTLREKYGIHEEAYEKMKLTICSEELHKQIISPPHHKSLYINILRYAALFILPLSLAGYLLLKDRLHPQVIPIATATITSYNERPRPKEVQLILSDGETIQLTREEKKVEVAPRILNRGNMLEYQKDTVSREEKKLIFNTIVVPATGEFHIRLADGTQVWLNENTRLKYPVEFCRNSREIHLLEGEIYLEVAQDSLHPFRVHTSQGNIEVLGTHFNVFHVPGRCTETTLAEGRVKVSRGQQEVILHPGQQARVTEQIKVEEVDIEEVICWKDNLFYFKDAELETILHKLADWYDFEIRWLHADLKAKKFFISIDKYASVKEILDKISEVSGIKFRIEGKTVNVHE